MLCYGHSIVLELVHSKSEYCIQHELNVSFTCCDKGGTKEGRAPNTFVPQTQGLAPI